MPHKNIRCDYTEMKAKIENPRKENEAASLIFEGF
jgi:hypothetical protein